MTPQLEKFLSDLRAKLEERAAIRDGIPPPVIVPVPTKATKTPRKVKGVPKL